MTSAILFRGFKGSTTSIINVVMGFLVICAGVVLLQLSKSAKDVPDTAVFAGDLDQVRTIAEQEQPESEPKADAIRGAAAIVRRFSTVRQQKEMQEAKRIHDEKQLDLQPISENEHIEWDGLRRRRTTIGTNPSLRSRDNLRSRDASTPFPAYNENPMVTVHTPQVHPPLGMSQFPDDDSESDDEQRERRNTSVSFFTRAKSIIAPSRSGTIGSAQTDLQSPMHPVPLTEISIPTYKTHGGDGSGGAYYGHDSQSHLPPFSQKTEYESPARDGGRHITIVDEGDRTGSRGSSLHPIHATGPTPPPHSARRQFSFQNVFRKGQSHAQNPEEIAQSRSPIIRQGRKNSTTTVKGATEEERLGLVKGDTRTGKRPSSPEYDVDDDEEVDDIDDFLDDKARQHSPDKGPPPPPKRTATKDLEMEGGEEEYYTEQRRRWEAQGGDAKGRPGAGGSASASQSPPRKKRDRNGSDDGGAFI